MKKHPVSDHSLQRFAAGASTRAESRSIVLHMLRGCASCAATLSASLRPEEIPPGAYDAVFEGLAGRLPPIGNGTLLAFEPRPAVPATPRPGRVAARGRR
jgi:hypothetical protein